ncbi:sensor histidine kinase [Adhaeribacter swui]|uniref:Sensor histidine kinase n=1 Tax=Adhaeribacter swui TaxID=2086471 RepID=A0A7G7GD85_9BACT|nr:sensor histidine kinase [Adhaeribacter swui]QNF35119.1 sensor histidine kinase [Adhaeribacter swui]
MFLKHLGLTLIVSLLFCSFRVKAQDAALPLLLAGKNDTTKVNQLIKYADKLTDNQPQEALPILNKIVNLSNRLNYPDGTGAALYLIGYVHLSSGNYPVAMRYYRQAAANYRLSGNLRKIAKCQTSIGNVYGYLGKTDSCISHFISAIKILEENKYQPELSRTYLNLGIMYDNIEEHQKSIFYVKKALAISRELNDTFLLNRELAELSAAHRQLGNFKQAYAYAAESLRLSKAKGTDKSMLSTAYDTYSNACVDLKRYDEAISAGKEAIKYASEIGQNQLYISAAMGLAGAYKEKGEHRQAITLLEATLKKCQDNGNVMFLREVYRFLAEGNYALGNYRQAYQHYENFNRYEDTLANQENRKAIAEMEIKYQTAQKEKALTDKQLQITQKDLQLQRNQKFTLVSVAATLVAILVASLIYLNLRNKRRIYTRQLKEVQQQKEIQVLEALMQGEEKERSRISKDLHDGVAGMLAAVKMHVNSLSLQNALVLEQTVYRQALHLLDEASYEVRKTAHNLMPEMLMQHGLDEALRRYCQNISNDHTLVVQYDSWGEIKRYKESFELSVYRIVQELLNNIMKHSRADRAIVQLSQRNNILSTTIEDNGIGFNRQEMKSDGLGLRSLQSRVQAINGKLEVEAQAGSGVSAYLEFETSGLEV